MFALTLTIPPPPTSSPFSRKPNSLKLLFRPLSSDSGRFSGRGHLMRELTVMPRLILAHANNSNGVSLEQEDDDSSSSPTFTSGFESTLNRLSKWIVVIFFAAVIMLRHDAEALWAAMGSVINSWVSIKLKHLLNQERPFGNLRSDPGMPSSHAQSIFFNFTFAVISLAQYFGVNRITIFLSVITMAFGSYLSWLRVSQQLHTINQVAVGAIVGTVFSVVWFWVWDAVVFNAFLAHSWVRILLFLTTVGICLGFLGYVIRYWFKYDIEPIV
ncbi:lipid phosphate phosphatase epsilon 2, chloroplastic-like [Impatiens glandulifera]|uniref:lipid phosphate phosphatase epsilon 2, chloroplastic-like n=1 Tax=Impatiens glandulifera TaxID=253017 RepID=UPI001FB18886|nr:lipid phosphate phosphatase epsilon 2, chloroplastic-like [Impatiens glandulifera]